VQYLNFNFQIKAPFIHFASGNAENILSFLAPPCIIIWQLMERHPTARAGTQGFSITYAFQK